MAWNSNLSYSSEDILDQHRILLQLRLEEKKCLFIEKGQPQGRLSATAGFYCKL